jgi:outer membrane protein assembly factor BamB
MPAPDAHRRDREAIRRQRMARDRVRAARRRGLARLAILLAAVGVVLGISVSQLSTGGPSSGGRSGPGAGLDTSLRSRAIAMPAVESGVEPWHLNAPLSREVVLPAANGTSIIVAGGLQGGSTTNGVFEVNPLTGSATQTATLAAPVHDAAGVVLDGKGIVFGGGSSSPAPTVQQLPGLGAVTGSGSGPPSARLSSLPQARADDAAVAIGSTAYVIGGYSGPSADAAVLSTTDGHSYKVVANLPVPVRYPAAAAFDGRIYVFGGDAASGARMGAPVSTVQVVDPSTRRASIVGRLPLPLAASAAAVLGGHLYLAGGETVPASASAGTAPRPVGTIYEWSVTRGKALVAGRLFMPVSHAGVTVLGRRAWLVGGETAPSSQTAAVQMFEPNPAFGIAGQPGAGSPYFGDTLLIADRGNNRLLALDDTGRIIWRYPGPGKPPPPGGFYFPDDAFFIHHGTAIISNQEENDTIVEIGYPSGKVLWQYGHPRQPGSGAGYLDNPDDAYLLKNGNITVADPKNCRVLVLSFAKRVLEQFGTPGSCTHQPPSLLGSPNGDTPLADGNLLVSEINGSWIDELTMTGHVVWSTHLNIGYPSDPQQIGPDKYLVCDYEHPGAFIEFDRSGKILYRYGPSSGVGELNQPSLAELLPSGVIMSNDDYNDRIVAVDPATGAVVWQYGKTGVTGTAPGLLNTPDGFDLLGPHGTYPTHPPTG